MRGDWERASKGEERHLFSFLSSPLPPLLNPPHFCPLTQEGIDRDKYM
jgi:hypothetical protein